MAGRWILGMRWEQLLFAHWPVPTDALAKRIPAGLELDTMDGAAWIGIVPFRMANVGLRGLALPGPLGRFGEANVRTYVRPTDPRNGQPGVWFLSLDAENPYVVAAGRAVFHVPYLRARIHMDDSADGVSYSLRRTHHGAPPARFRATYRATGTAASASPGSLQEWLTERHAVYAADPRGRLVRGDIRHEPWRLAPAAWHLERETLLAALGIRRPEDEALLYLAEPVDVVAAWPTSLG
ncbi:MAG: YqjF family protein [Chloroflexota bacterium]